MASLPASGVEDARVVDLEDARLSRRLATYRERLEIVLRANQDAVGQLYESGTLFTRVGLRAGQDLLLAHEHLLRVMRLVDRLAHRGDVPAPRRPNDIDALFGELDTLLERTQELSGHTRRLLGESV